MKWRVDHLQEQSVKLCSLALSLTVLQVANKRWRIDLRSRQAAALMLSAVNLPGGVQVLSCHLAIQHALCLKSLHACLSA